MSFTDADVAAGTKGAVHGAVFTLAAMCAIYNACACRVRPTGPLLLNVVVYVGLMGFEVMNVQRHCRDGRRT